MSCAATLLTVVLGARVLASGTRTVSRGVALVRKPRVDGARVQRVVRSKGRRISGFDLGQRLLLIVGHMQGKC